MRINWLTLWSAKVIIVPHQIITCTLVHWLLTGTVREAEWGCSAPMSLLAVSNVTAHPSTASVPITILLYNGPLLCSFKGLRLRLSCSICTAFAGSTVIFSNSSTDIAVALCCQLLICTVAQQLDSAIFGWWLPACWTAPYLADDCQLVADVARCNLCSSYIYTCVELHTLSCFGDRLSNAPSLKLIPKLCHGLPVTSAHLTFTLALSCTHCHASVTGCLMLPVLN